MPLKWLLRRVAVLHREGRTASTVGSESFDARKDTPWSSSPCSRYYRQCIRYFLCFVDRLDCSGSGDASDSFADGNG